MKPKHYVVYSLPRDWQPRLLDEMEADALWANADNVNALFQGEPQLRKRFLQFLNQGNLGVFFADGSDWMCYAWMTTPGHCGPAHMRVAPRENSNWIFHCRTHERFRGRGLFKQALHSLASQALKNHPDSFVYVDTEVENVPSRRAILSTGFQPHGVAHVWTLRIPKVKWWTRTVWHPDQTHPVFVDERHGTSGMPRERDDSRAIPSRMS